MELYAELVLIKEDTGKFYRGGDLKEIIMARQLYHYTSLETLHAIISEIDNSDSHFVYFKLRATNAYYLNDLTEGRLLLSALKKLGKTAFGGYTNVANHFWLPFYRFFF